MLRVLSLAALLTFASCSSHQHHHDGKQCSRDGKSCCHKKDGKKCCDGKQCDMKKSKKKSKKKAN